MTFEPFIAKRLNNHGKNRFSKPILQIAVWGIALGMAVMIITLSIVKGFQRNVSSKITSFSSPLTITKITSSDAYETPPIGSSYTFLDSINRPKYIKNVQAFANKAGVIKVDKDVHGIILKGLGSNYSQEYLSSCLIDGDSLDLSSSKREILISSTLSIYSEKKVGDKIKVYFISQNKKTGSFQQRMYPFVVKGIYNSGLSDDFDKRFMMCNLTYIQKLNYWDSNMVGGYEILLDNIHPTFKEAKEYDFNFKLNSLYTNNYEFLEFVKDDFYDKYYHDIGQLKITTVKDKYPQIFDWLKLFDTHVITVISIIIIISIINMIAVLFILLIEKTSFIGILKALGANSKSIQKIFIYQSARIIVKGLLFGNILGIGLSLVQLYFKPVSLDETVYYIAHVPIEFNWPMIILVNLLTIICCIISLILPSRYISKVYPSKSIRFS